MEKLRIILCPLVFCLFLLVFSALLLFWPDREYSEGEKRYLAQKPEFSWDALLEGDYQTDLELWLEDQFPGRDTLVGIHAYWQLLQGRNTQQGIYFAEDGYLIQDPEVLNLENYEKNLTRFNDFAAESGLPSHMILVPTAGHMLEDKLPFGHGEYTDDLLYETAQTLMTDAALWDPRAALADCDSQVYYKTDHHVTMPGHYAIYSFWRSGLERPFLNETDYSVEIHDGFRGTTWSGSGYWLNPADQVELWDSGAEVTVTISDGGTDPVVSDTMFFRSHLEELDMYPVYLDGNHALVEIENPEASEGTILLIKDSYAHSFAPLLADHYQKVILLDLRFYRGSVTDLIREKQVDELLFFYGIQTLLTDTNSAWLF